MSNFKLAIESAILLFPLVALLFTIPYVIFQYHKYGSVSSFRTIIVYSFILYGMSAYFLVILPLPSIEYVSKITMPSYNLQPFHFISEIFNNTPLVLSDFKTYFPTLKNAVVYEAIFNVCLTIPFGVYLHYYFRCGFLKTLFYSFCLTLFFELTQLSGLYFIYPRSYRVFDVDDLLLNTFGGVIGYFIGSFLLLFLPSRERIDEKSYFKGQSVSFLRRLSTFGIDLFIVLVLVFCCSYFVYRYNFSKLLLLLPFIFYIMIVLLFKRSVGMVLVNLEFIRSDGKDLKWYDIFFYYFFFFLEYVFLFSFVIFGGYYLRIMKIINQNVWDYIKVIVLALMVTLYVISFLKRLFHVPLIYERLSKIELKSTIKSL